MKKLLPIVTALAFVALSATAQLRAEFLPTAKHGTAQNMITAPMFVGNTQITANPTERLFNGMNAPARFRQAPAQAPGDIELMYNYPYEGLYYDMTDEGSSYAAIRMVTNAFSDVQFINYSYRDLENNEWERLNDVQWSWVWSDGDVSEPLEQSMDDRGSLTAQAFGYMPFPTVSYGSKSFIANYVDEDNGSTYSSVWQAGTDGMAQFAFRASDSDETEYHDGFVSNAIIQFGAYGNFGKASNEDIYGFVPNQTFYDLTDYQTTNEFHNTGKKVKGLAEYYVNPSGHVFATDVTAAFWISNIATAGQPFDGETLTASIYTFNEEAENGMELYAEAMATDEDAVAIGTNGFYIVKFKFIEEDPMMGKIEMPIVLPDEDFIVIITGFDNVKSTVCATFAGAEGFSGNAYALLDDGSLGTIGYSNSPDNPQVNLHIGFHAAFPVAEPFDEDALLIAPEEGGWLIAGYNNDGSIYNSIGMYTLTNPLEEDGDWMVEGPEWIDGLDVENERLDYGYVYFYLHAEALPEGVEGREGDVVFSLLGKEVTFRVAQGVTESTKNRATYAMTEGETHASGESVDVKNLMGDVVATLQFGFADQDDPDFNKAVADKSVAGFTAYTTGNNANGRKTSGTAYVIAPKYDGEVEVAVALEANKQFYVLEDGKALTNYNGIKVDAEYKGTYKFTVKAGKSYTIYASGSKLGFYGFNYTITGAIEDGIQLVNANEATANSQMYNMQGQRISAPANGLYIMNGRKYMVK